MPVVVGIECLRAKRPCAEPFVLVTFGRVKGGLDGFFVETVNCVGHKFSPFQMNFQVRGVAFFRVGRCQVARRITSVVPNGGRVLKPVRNLSEIETAPAAQRPRKGGSLKHSNWGCWRVGPFGEVQGPVNRDESRRQLVIPCAIKLTFLLNTSPPCSTLGQQVLTQIGGLNSV